MPEKPIKIEVRRRKVSTVKYGDPIHISFKNAPIASRVEIINTVNKYNYHWAYIGGTGGFDFVIPWFWGKEEDRYVNYEIRYPDRSYLIELIRDSTPKIYFASDGGIVLTRSKDYFPLRYFNNNNFDCILISPTGREINLGKDQWAVGRPGQFGAQTPSISVKEGEKGGVWKAVMRDDSGKIVSNTAEMFYFGTKLCSVRFDKAAYQVGEKMKIYCENAGPKYLLTIFERWDRGNEIEGHILTKTDQVFEHIIIHNFDHAVELVYEPYSEYASAVCQVGGWTKQDFVTALQDKGAIPLEKYPPGGWLRGWSRTEPYMLEYQKGELTLGIDLEAPRCKDNPPTGIDCVRWDCPGNYCPFTSKTACFLPRPFVEEVQEAIRKLYGEIDYLACMVIRPESDRYIPTKKPVDVRFSVSNCGTKKSKIKGVVKKQGEIFIEIEKLMGVNEDITVSKEFFMPEGDTILEFYAFHQENSSWKEDEYRHVKLIATPTELPKTPQKPAPVAGTIVVVESLIPEEIYLAKSSIFAMQVENTGEEVVTYKVALTFTGIDVAKEYAFASEWSETVKHGERTKLNVEVTLPEDAIPPDKDEVIYDISTTLEALL